MSEQLQVSSGLSEYSITRSLSPIDLCGHTSLTYSPTQPLISPPHPFRNAQTHPPTHSLKQSLIHSFIHSFTHLQPLDPSSVTHVLILTNILTLSRTYAPPSTYGPVRGVNRLVACHHSGTHFAGLFPCDDAVHAQPT